MAATILICDDSETIRGLVQAALDGAGYAFVEARDGDESVELARSLKPDLVLLDMMMPRRSGLEVLRELRGDPELAGTPVIMLTARAQAHDRDAAADVGADHYLPKPFSIAELASLVERFLERSR
jgi:DNA-binding response OmpR family regulator